jgi:hypothetical protein
LTRALTYLVRMVDGSNRSCHDPAVGPHHFHGAPSPGMSAVPGTLGHPSRRFDDHAHRWGSVDPRANLFGQNGRFDRHEPQALSPGCMGCRPRRFVGPREGQGMGRGPPRPSASHEGARGPHKKEEKEKERKAPWRGSNPGPRGRGFAPTPEDACWCARPSQLLEGWPRGHPAEGSRPGRERGARPGDRWSQRASVTDQMPRLCAPLHGLPPKTFVGARARRSSSEGGPGDPGQVSSTLRPGRGRAVVLRVAVPTTQPGQASHPATQPPSPKPPSPRGSCRRKSRREGQGMGRGPPRPSASHEGALGPHKN